MQYLAVDVNLIYRDFYWTLVRPDYRYYGSDLQVGKNSLSLMLRSHRLSIKRQFTLNILQQKDQTN